MSTFDKISPEEVKEVLAAITSTADLGFVVDEDAQTSDSPVLCSTQQSIKAYVDVENVTPRARALRGADQTTSGGVDTTVAFTSPNAFDTNSIHDRDTPVLDERLIAPIDGFYLISGSVRWKENPTGDRQASLNHSRGPTVIQSLKVNAVATGVTDILLFLGIEMLAGEYVWLSGKQTSGGNLKFEGVGTQLTMIRMGR